MRPRAMTWRMGLHVWLLTALLALTPCAAQQATEAPAASAPPTSAAAPATDSAAAPPAWNGQSSPRATMFTFLQAMSERTPAFPVDGVAFRKVRACFPAAAKDAQVRAAALHLLQVIDQLGKVEETDLPGADELALSQQQRFTFFPVAGVHDWVYAELKGFGRWPEGSIELIQTAEAQWVFSPGTLAGIEVLAQSMAPLPPRYTAPQRSVQQAGRLVALVGPTFAHTHLWQWGALLAAIFGGLLLGKLISSGLRRASDRAQQQDKQTRAVICRTAASPLSLALLTVGLSVGLSFIHQDEALTQFIQRVLALLFLISIGWFAYNLIDLVDILLTRLTAKTESKLDDMIVPLIRKTLRIFLVIVFTLVVLQNVFEMNITGFLASLGIAGLAISLAAQDSVKNLFGSLTVFFDKPFLIGDRIKFDGTDGIVEEIGFRSTRIRTLEGHLVTVPNMKFIDGSVENVAARPSIRRILDVTITYDTPLEKIQEGVQILRNLLAEAEIAAPFDLENLPPRVYFNDYNAASLNLRVIYWYTLADGRDYWGFLAHSEAFNLKLFDAYAKAGIEFAFPTQTLYLAGDPNRPLNVGVPQLKGGEGRAYT